MALDGSISTTSENMPDLRDVEPAPPDAGVHGGEPRDASYVGDEIHPGETVEEKISLSERFGLWVTFYPFDQDEYLEIVEHWLKTSAAPRDDAHEEALQWALQRGSRSGRVAYQFARDWAGRAFKEEVM